MTEGPQGEPGKDAEPEPIGRVFIVLLIASLVVVVIGVQALLSHRSEQADDLAQERHDTQAEVCQQEWADAFKDSVTLARSFNKRLEVAEARRDASIDSIILDVVAGQNQPEGQPVDPAVMQDFQADLDEFVAALDNLNFVKKEVEADRDDNPYPKLDPNCEAGKSAARKVE